MASQQGGAAGTESVTCGISGQWHLGDSPRPQKRFSRWYVHQFGGGPYYNAPMIQDGRLIAEPGHVAGGP